MDKKDMINKAKVPQKKKLIKTQRERNITRIIITVAILLIVAIVYYLIDSARYVATVDKHRISKSLYQFFLQ